MIDVDANATTATAEVTTSRAADTLTPGMTDVQPTIDAHTAPDMWSQPVGADAVSNTGFPRLTGW